MNHHNRSAGFALLFVTIVLHLASPTGPVVGTPLIYSLLALHFLGLPHVMVAWARRSAKPLRAELGNLLLDAVCLGAWTGAIGFPLWLGFGMFIGAAVNLAAFRGVIGPPMAIMGFAVGATLGAALGGWQFAPQTSLTVTLLAVLSTTLHLLVVVLNVYRRSVALDETRDQLRDRDAALSGRLTEIQALKVELREAGNRDALTGLYNRRYLESTLPREWARSQRAQRPISVLLIDVDHLQRVNARHGHPAGDAVLGALGARLARLVRTADVACRYDGEAFLLLFPDMALATAAQRAEHVRAEVEALRIEFEGATIQATVSVGLAVWPDHTDRPESLISMADAALNRAKDDGRNRVVVTSDQRAAPPAT